MKTLYAFLTVFAATFLVLYLVVAFVAWDTMWAPANFFHHRNGVVVRIALLAMGVISFAFGSAAASPKGTPNE